MGAPKTPAPPELHDEQWLRHEYVVLRKSGPEIARQLGLKDTSLVYRYLDRHNIERRARSAKKDFATTVAEGIRLTREADADHNRKPSISFFMARVRAVVTVKAEGGAIALRGALMDLAALCEAWAEEIVFNPMMREP